MRSWAGRRGPRVVRMPERDTLPQGAEGNIRRRYVGRKLRETIYRMYLEGMDYKAIGRKTGRSKSTIAQVVTRYNRGEKKGLLLERAIGRIIYPGIREWMLDAGASIPEAARACGIPEQTLRGWLQGTPKAKRGESMPKWAIDRMLAWTGLTYEQAFRAEDE